MRVAGVAVGVASILSLVAACGSDSGKTWTCQAPAGDAPDSLADIGCQADFELLASRPLDASIPGARSVKTILDRADDNTLHFQNSTRFETHYQFASTHLSGNGLPLVPMLSSFNTTEYFSPSRRFVLGALTHYEQPDKWVFELSPYDTADAELVATAYAAIAAHSFIGAELYYHPSSEANAAVVPDLPASVKVITTDELYAGIDYQALNVGESYGQLRFLTAAQLAGTYVTFRDIVVLDHVPNDISVTMGIITEAFQTPLSHVNVLSRNRGTPNMALRGAFDDVALRALEGKWVRFTVGPFDYAVEEVDQAVADAWWEDNKPAEIQVPGADLGVTDLRDDVAIVGDVDGSVLRDAIKTAIRAFGGKAGHYGALSHVPGVPVPKAFAVPIFYYQQFMEQNGFDTRIAALLEDPEFIGDPAVRQQALTDLRADMQVAPVDPAFEALLVAKLEADFPDTRMRFRSSTNAEDLDGFTGAGLYESKSGEIDDPGSPVLGAVRAVWASVWSFRAFEERSYRSIDHLAVGMALLVHRSFPEEEANGVALTNNPYDTSGLEPALYVNVQQGEASVVSPDPGVTTDQFLYFSQTTGQPVVYIAHSSLVPLGQHVLSDVQIASLGDALDAIHAFFRAAYGGDGTGWYAMDVEFKFEGEPGEAPQLFIKQARPHGN